MSFPRSADVALAAWSVQVPVALAAFVVNPDITVALIPALGAFALAMFAERAAVHRQGWRCLPSRVAAFFSKPRLLGAYLSACLAPALVAEAASREVILLPLMAELTAAVVLVDVVVLGMIAVLARGVEISPSRDEPDDDFGGGWGPEPDWPPFTPLPAPERTRELVGSGV